MARAQLRISESVAAWLLPGSSMAAAMAAKRQLAERLGVHDEALRLARTTGHDYAYWVDYLALALKVAEQLRRM
jgi:hypothetical protein